MKKPLALFFLILFVPICLMPQLCAQSIKGGKLTYEQVVDYELDGAYKEQVWKDYIEGLPKSGKSIHVLYFNSEESLYEEEGSKKAVMSEHLKTALMKANYYKTPKPQVKQVHVDLQGKKQVEQVSFLTRDFLVESAMETKAWKLTARRKKVMDYICMGADLEMEEETITAWFSPELPFSVGPASYNGLPGVILALEKNKEVFLLATAIDLEVSNERLADKLNKGQKVGKNKFELIVKEKSEEFKKNREIEKKNNSKLKKN